MAVKVIRWYRSRRNQLLIFISVIVIIVYYYMTVDNMSLSSEDLDLRRRESIEKYIERQLEENLKEDKGTGCEMPVLDPFSPEITQFNEKTSKITCDGRDWVKCYLSECRVVKEILDKTQNVECLYQDIIYHSDDKFTVSKPVVVNGDNPYVLVDSDHVKVTCSGKPNSNLLFKTKWVGYALGCRKSVVRKPVPKGREDALNVLIFGFDSTSKNQFIRKMPRSLQIIKDLGAVILNGYNIVGDGTPAALFPILTGKTEIELPEARKKKSDTTLDVFPFLFYTLKENGYRTAYLEDMPWIGTFQYRFNGFKNQPADHYLRAFFMEESKQGAKWWKGGKKRYCVGATPSYQLMINYTRQFFDLDGKKFCFSFVADITHDGSLISTADDEFADLLMGLQEAGKLDDTLLFVMGDHGARFTKIRATFQGKLEERLPLMAIVLPDKLKKQRPHLQSVLQSNAGVLTTPHDIYATILDALDLKRYNNPYRIKGADLTRGLTLFEPVWSNRSCSAAGVEAHWCACLAWNNVSSADPLYQPAALALLHHLNDVTESMRGKCALRSLGSVEWVLQQRANKHVLSFSGARDPDGYVGSFHGTTQVSRVNYQVKIITQPGGGMYEASMTYLKNENRFMITNRDIQRINAYGDDPSCVSATHPHLNMFCYCRQPYRT